MSFERISCSPNSRSVQNQLNLKVVWPGVVHLGWSSSGCFCCSGEIFTGWVVWAHYQFLHHQPRITLIHSCLSIIIVTFASKDNALNTLKTEAFIAAETARSEYEVLCVKENMTSARWAQTYLGTFNASGHLLGDDGCELRKKLMAKDPNELQVTNKQRKLSLSVCVCLCLSF